MIRGIPRRAHKASTFSTGKTKPNTLETWVNTTQRVSSVSASTTPL